MNDTCNGFKCNCDREYGCDSRNISIYHIDELEENILELSSMNITEGTRLDGNTFCIRGYYAADGYYNIFDFGGLLDIACDGEETCDDIYLYGYNIYARGEYAIGGSKAEVHVSGDIKDGSVGNLYCEGDTSCANFEMISGFKNIYCLSMFSFLLYCFFVF